MAQSLPNATFVSPPGAAPPGAAPDHLRKRRDFLAANAGVRIVTPAFILLVRENGEGVTRAGFTVSRKVGNSVARNRARRRLREVARAMIPASGAPGADHVFIARSTSTERPFSDLLADARAALGKARRKMVVASRP